MNHVWCFPDLLRNWRFFQTHLCNTFPLCSVVRQICCRISLFTSCHTSL
uniref:Uncharacterized protein n=1 Tax=Anguilla anguilla TaxID=7936 RepID=A0A0E9V103_ANGAN